MLATCLTDSRDRAFDKEPSGLKPQLLAALVDTRRS